MDTNNTDGLEALNRLAEDNKKLNEAADKLTESVDALKAEFAAEEAGDRYKGIATLPQKLDGFELISDSYGNYLFNSYEYETTDGDSVNLEYDVAEDELRISTQGMPGSHIIFPLNDAELPGRLCGLSPQKYVDHCINTLLMAGWIQKRKIK